MTKSRGIRIQKGTRPRWVAENQGQHMCGCGCDRAVDLRPEHYPNAPRFIHGHNPAVTHVKPKPDPALCECGCGELASVGKRYIAGHNSKGRQLSDESRQRIADAHRGEKSRFYGKPPWNLGSGKPVPDAVPCACGCGSMATAGRKFISGHNGRGQRLSNYTGRFVSDYHGYAWVHMPGHPFAQKGWVREHRMVIEQHLIATSPGSDMLVTLGVNLYLSPEIVVHHVNGVKDDNRLENLQAMTNAEHVRLHHDQGDIRHHRH